MSMTIEVGNYTSSAPGLRTYIGHLQGEADFSRPSLLPPGPDRKIAVFNELQAVNAQAMEQAGSHLNQLFNQGLISSFRVNPLSNTVIIDVPDEKAGEAWRAINQVPGMGRVIRDREVSLQPLEQAQQGADLVQEGNKRLEWNVARLGVEELWKQGITGKGIVVGIVDTGVDLKHPSLESKYRGFSEDGKHSHDYNFFDAFKQSSVPYDDNRHGTHVAGTVLGSTEDGYYTGMAPDAQWIGAKILSGRGSGSLSTVLAGIEWMLAPTDASGRNPDPTKAPDLLNHSWGTTDGRTQAFRQVWKAYEAAGIVPVVAAGNSGPRAASVGAPGSYPESIAVGATDKDDRVARFSSRGPSPIRDEKNPEGFKPDVSAPGHQVTAAVPGGGYQTLSGTSMASPAVAGVVALLLQKHPDLTNEEVRKALTTSARDIDAPGPDLNSGHGIVDAPAAMKAADRIVAERTAPRPEPVEPEAVEAGAAA